MAISSVIEVTVNCSLCWQVPEGCVKIGMLAIHAGLYGVSAVGCMACLRWVVWRVCGGLYGVSAVGCMACLRWVVWRVCGVHHHTKAVQIPGQITNLPAPWSVEIVSIQ